MVQTPVVHVAGKVHVVVHSIVHGFDAIGVVVGHDRVVGSLDVFVDDAVDLERIVSLHYFAS